MQSVPITTDVVSSNLQLPMQSVPNTTDVVSSNLDQSEVYTIYVIQFVSDLWQVDTPVASTN